MQWEKVGRVDSCYLSVYNSCYSHVDQNAI